MMNEGARNSADRPEASQASPAARACFLHLAKPERPPAMTSASGIRKPSVVKAQHIEIIRWSVSVARPRSFAAAFPPLRLG
jgi:hypothetical protein